jgi:antitoxin MazE
MELSLVNIGDSKGIRLSKTILEKYNFSDKVELVLEDEFLILKPKSEPRKGWEAAFKKMHDNGDDQLLMDDVFENEHFEEWSK